MALRKLIRPLGTAAATGLLAAALLHMIWLFSPWPLESWVSWSRTFGNAEFRVPDRIMASVATLFAIAAYIVAVQAGLLRRIGPAWIYRAGTWVIAILFVLRAGLGFVEMSDLLDDPRMTAQFRETTWLYLLIYLPVFLVLGLLSGGVAIASRLPRKTA